GYFWGSCTDRKYKIETPSQKCNQVGEERRVEAETFPKRRSLSRRSSCGIEVCCRVDIVLRGHADAGMPDIMQAKMTAIFATRLQTHLFSLRNIPFGVFIEYYNTEWCILSIESQTGGTQMHYPRIRDLR